MTAEFLGDHPEQQKAPTAEQKKAINRLHKVNHRLRRVQHPFESAPINSRLQAVYAAIAESTNENIAQDFLRLQMGIQDGPIAFDESELEGLPPHAVRRFVDMYNHRLESIWPWLTLVDTRQFQVFGIEIPEGDYQWDLGEFVGLYKHIADEIGLFPSPARVENVPKQRWVQHASRSLAGHLEFYRAIQNSGSLSVAAQGVVDSINTARSNYAMHDKETLQRVMIAKSGFSPERIQELREDGLWEDHEDLTYMCVDRGLRDTLLGHYGIMRDMFGGTTSGYLNGQAMLALRGVLRVH